MIGRHLFAFEGWRYFFAWCCFVALALGASLGVCIWVSMTYPQWNPGWGIFGVAFVGVWIAAFGIIRVRFTARQRETLKFMNDYNNDPMVSEGFAVIQRIKRLPEHDKPAAIVNALNREHNGGQERMHFLFLANKFEILAIGLEDRIYDQEMIDRFLGRDIVEIYKDSLPLIKRIRESASDAVGDEDDPVAFEEFEKLAKKVKKRRLKSNS